MEDYRPPWTSPVHVALVYAPDADSASSIPPQSNDLAPAASPPPRRHHRRPAPARRPSSAPPPDNTHRHRRRCQICRHPELDLIEADFLQWRSPVSIAREFQIPEVSLYRHAHAFGLFALRRENLRLALDRVIERGAQVENSGDTIIRAVRAQACLTGDNRWVEPARHIILSPGAPPRDADPAPPVLPAQLLIDTSTIRK